MQILKRCANNFFHWDEILDRRPGGQVLQDYVSRRIFSRISMTLRSLKTYGYISSKTKNYRNIKRISSTIYLLTLQTLVCRPQCLQTFHPWQKHNLPKPRILKSVPTIWTIPRSLSPSLATRCPSPKAAPERPTSPAIAFTATGAIHSPGSRTRCVQRAVLSPPAWWFYRPRASCRLRTLPQHTASHWFGWKIDWWTRHQLAVVKL